MTAPEVGVEFVLTVIVLLRARFFILSFVLVALGGAPVYAADTCQSIFERPGTQVLREMRGQLASMLVRGGTMGVPDGSEIVLVATVGDSVMNKFAAKLASAYGARLIAYPEKLETLGAQAAMLNMNFGQGLQPTLVFGPSTLLRASRDEDPMKDPLILHEMRHIQLLADLAKKKPNALYGWVRATKGKIPDKLKGIYNGYQNFMSFDEVKTYHQQAKQDLSALSEALRTGKDLNAATARVRSSLGHGFPLSNRARTVARLLLSEKIATTYVMNDELVEAHIKLSLDGAELEVEIPLVASSSEHDPRNDAHLHAQLVALEATATAANAQFLAAGQLFNQSLAEMSPGAVSRLQTILNPLELKKFLPSGEPSIPPPVPPESKPHG